ncbi:MAG: rRNA maturation RNase YbeY [Gammaproteobacteria bacterium]|nr:rRNA maturation RNase YbeY [Gammaproteobacteria bacterium]
MPVRVSVQRASKEPAPLRGQLVRWVRHALAGRRRDAALTVRLVDDAESAALNLRWRHREGSTNVLSFPAGEMPESMQDVLGDIVVCAPLVAREAMAQGKPVEAHWAHLVVHGTLHLLGFDHVKSREATVMEDTERQILSSLGYPDPYQES